MRAAKQEKAAMTPNVFAPDSSLPRMRNMPQSIDAQDARFAVEDGDCGFWGEI